MVPKLQTGNISTQTKSYDQGLIKLKTNHGDWFFLDHIPGYLQPISGKLITSACQLHINGNFIVCSLLPEQFDWKGEIHLLSGIYPADFRKFSTFIQQLRLLFNLAYLLRLRPTFSRHQSPTTSAAAWMSLICGPCKSISSSRLSQTVLRLA